VGFPGATISQSAPSPGPGNWNHARPPGDAPGVSHPDRARPLAPSLADGTVPLVDLESADRRRVCGAFGGESCVNNSALANACERPARWREPKPAVTHALRGPEGCGKLSLAPAFVAPWDSGTADADCPATKGWRTVPAANHAARSVRQGCPFRSAFTTRFEGFHSHRLDTARAPFFFFSSPFRVVMPDSQQDRLHVSNFRNSAWIHLPQKAILSADPRHPPIS